MIRKSPCYKCPDRAIGCHGKCEKYQDYQQACRAEYSARLAHSDVMTYEARKEAKARKQWERKEQLK